MLKKACIGIGAGVLTLGLISASIIAAEENDSYAIETENAKLSFVGSRILDKSVPYGDAADKEYVLVIFAYENYTTEPKMPQQDFYPRVFQNGVELSKLSSRNVNESEDCVLLENYYKNVIKGGTLEYGDAYELSDESPLTVVLAENGLSTVDSVSFEINIGDEPSNGDEASDDSAESTEDTEAPEIEVSEVSAASSNPYIGQVISLGGGYEVLQNGSQGEAAQKLQQALIDQGFLDGAADGKYGNGTAGGVSRFQESAGIDVTGVADEETQSKLFGESYTNAEDIQIVLSGVSETDYMKINGLFCDESYVKEDNESLTMLYICYSAFTSDENMQIDSKSSDLKINNVNTYTSEHYPGVCRYLGSYYYSDYLKDVYIGDEVKVVETFRVPKGELEPGRQMTFVSSQIPDSDKISLNTDDIIHCDNAKTIAQIIDPEGYAEVVYKLSPADSETIAKVKNAINGYGWDFYVNSLSYYIEFYDNEYDLETVVGTTYGTYTVLNGYVVLKNGETGAENYVPYSWGPYDIDLDICAGFDVKEN